MSSILLATPQEWFDELNKEFNLEVDYAASDDFHLLPEYVTKEENALERDWDKSGWCSPPWNGEKENSLATWVRKGIKEHAIHNQTIVMLLPVREEAAWWEQSKFADEIRPVDIDFIPMEGPKDRKFTVEPHCLWIFKGASMEVEKGQSDVLEERIRDIHEAFNDQYPRFHFTAIVETHENEVEPFLIMNLIIDDITDGFYRITYTYADEQYMFADPILWREVESQVDWIDVVKAAKAMAISDQEGGDAAVEFDIDACPKKMIKVIKAHEDESLTIGAYATIWGELDCDGERMQKEALEPYVNSNATPYMFWLHGWDQAFGSTLVGEWDKTTFTIDDVGLYVEGTVRHPEAIRRLQQAGEFGLSVGSNPKFVQVDGLGNITDWALLEISIMEGGKQCVPNARREIDKVDDKYEDMLASKAAEFGEQEEVPAPRKVTYYRIGGELIRGS